MYCQFPKNGYIGSFNAWCCCTGFRHLAHGCIKQRVQLCRVCLHHEPKVNSSWRRRKLVYFFGIMSFIKILILTVKVTNLLFLTGSGEDINSCSASLPAGTIYTVGAKQKWLHFYAELQNSELFLFHLFFFLFHAYLCFSCHSERCWYFQAVIKHSTDAMKDSRVLDYVNMVMLNTYSVYLLMCFFCLIVCTILSNLFIRRIDIEF